MCSLGDARDNERSESAPFFWEGIRLRYPEYCCPLEWDDAFLAYMKKRVMRRSCLHEAAYYERKHGADRRRELMNGAIDLTMFTPAADMNVENEFAEGSYCDKLYTKMLSAYESLCRRLGNTTGEDVDVELIINNLSEIGRHMSMKIYDYGTKCTIK